MIKRQWPQLILLKACLFTGGTVIVQAAEIAPTRVNIGVDAAYRMDKLNWNIANEATATVAPDIISELRWKNLKILQNRVQINVENGRMVFLGTAAYGKIISGNNEDSDYAGNNRTQEWSRSLNDGSDGNTGDISTALGYHVGIETLHLSFIPLAGYVWHNQSLHMRHGIQTVSRTATINGIILTAQPLGPLTGLDSAYTATWKGPWLGIKINWQQNRWNAQLTTRYAWLDYKGEASWNLRADLQHPVSFLHLVRGFGWRLGGSVDYAATPQWSIGVDAYFSRYTTYIGTDTQFGADHSVSETRLNKVNWNSMAVGLTAVYRY